MAGRRGKRRISAARIARRAALALDDATQTAVEALDYAEQCGIVCVDGPQLHRWQEDAGRRPWEAQPSAA
ncbi:hypothetical protein [Streptomyces sp. NPDC127038]